MTMKFCTHMVYIFVGSYTKFEVDGSVRYRDIAINVKWGQKMTPSSSCFKGSMPPSIGHMELLVWMQRADFSEHIQGCKSPGDPLNSSHFDAPNTKSAPTGYRRAPNIISHHYKQQLSAKASIVPKARPIRFRSNGSLKLSAAQNSHKCHMRAKVNITRY